ncbi:MAG: hypothetical protein M3H12_14500 [Chromatiales bacterium]|nr:hypothetical protein [Gammaproteobacteria bacterium]
MFGFLGSLFGTAKAGETIVEGISNAADKLFYTDEEQAEDAAKARTEGFGVYMAWLESTSGSRLARRVIALMVTGIWATEHMMSVALGSYAVFATDPVKWERVSAMLAGNATENNALVGVVLLFYFGGPAAMEGVKGLVDRWVKR